MSTAGRQEAATTLLQGLVDEAGFLGAIVCTDDGLLVACTGDLLPAEQLAGVTSLVDDVVGRSERRLGLRRVDEVTVLDPGLGRLVVRPLRARGRRFHLVVRVPPRASWRRHTNRVVRRVTQLLEGV